MCYRRCYPALVDLGSRTGVQAEAEAVAESGCGVELPSALAAGNLLAHGDVQLRLAAELRLAAAAQLRLAAEPIGVGCGARQSESTLDFLQPTASKEWLE